MSERLIIFAKAPRVGAVKTRLIPSLGAEGACSAYIRLLKALASNLKTLREVTVFHSPADAENELRDFFPPNWKFYPQEGVTLGDRLSAAFTRLFRESKKIVAIGSDCPYLAESDIRSAFALLDSNELVFGPARDGGYWLIGMKAAHSALFENIDWGTDQVFKQTLKKARALGLKTELLRELADIDTPLEWDEYCRWQAISATGAAREDS